LAWAVDFFSAVPESGSAAVSGLFIVMALLAPASVVPGLFFRVVLGPVDPFSWFGARVRDFGAYLWHSDPVAGFRFLGRAVSAALCLGAAAAAAILACLAIAEGVVTPGYRAVLSVAATAGAAVVTLPAYLFLDGLLRISEPPLARLKLVHRLWERPLLPFLLTVAAVIVAGYLVVVRFKTAVKVIEWTTPLMIASTFLVSMACAAAVVRAMRSLLAATVFSAVVVGLFLAGGAASVLLQTGDSTALRYFKSSRTTGLAFGVFVKLLDSDHDGFIHAFGGGDCAPDDPSTFPAALDVPGNGVDEDCDGHDVTPAAIETPRWDFPVSTRFPKIRIPVFLITMDAVSWYHLSMNGYERDTTPNLDLLSEDCVVFDLAFSQGPSTRLSFAAAFTSQYDTQIEREYGVNVPYPLSDDNLTMAEIFQRNGYETVTVVASPYFTQRWKGILQGFDTVDRSPILPGKAGLVANNADKVTAASLKQIRARRGHPMFFWTHYYDPHGPHNPPRSIEAYGKSKEDKYDTEIRWMDKHIGPLIHEIRTLYTRTGYLLIVAADHGTSFDANHPKYSHGIDLFTTTTRVPLMVCSPAMDHKIVGRTPVSLIDVLPTVVNLLGLKAAGARFEGTSLVPLLWGDAEWPDRVVFQQFFLIERAKKGQEPLAMASVRTNSHNYIWDREKGKYLLFDYRNDYEETDNLLAQEPGLAQPLDSMLKTWLYRVHRKYGPAAGARAHEDLVETGDPDRGEGGDDDDSNGD